MNVITDEIFRILMIAYNPYIRAQHPKIGRIYIFSLIAVDHLHFFLCENYIYWNRMPQHSELKKSSHEAIRRIAVNRAYPNRSINTLQHLKTVTNNLESCGQC